MTDPDVQTQRQEADPTNASWELVQTPVEAAQVLLLQGQLIQSALQPLALESWEGIIPARLIGTPFT